MCMSEIFQQQNLSICMNRAHAHTHAGQEVSFDRDHTQHTHTHTPKHNTYTNLEFALWAQELLNYLSLQFIEWLELKMQPASECG